MATEVLPGQRRRHPATQQWAPPCRLAGRTWQKTQGSTSIVRSKSVCSQSKRPRVYSRCWDTKMALLTRMPSTLRLRNPGAASSLPSLLGNSGYQYRWPNFWGWKKKTASQRTEQNNLSVDWTQTVIYDRDISPHEGNIGQLIIKVFVIHPFITHKRLSLCPLFKFQFMALQFFQMFLYREEPFKIRFPKRG